MSRGQIDAIDQLTEMIKMLGNGSSTGQSYSGEATNHPMGAIEGLVIAQRDMANDLGIHLDRLAAAIEAQTEAQREMTEYLARAIDSRK